MNNPMMIEVDGGTGKIEPPSPAALGYVFAGSHYG
jgi:hypothetical protein